MSEKEFNFQEEFPDKVPAPELETPEEAQVASEHEEVTEVSLAFPENAPWPPQQPESQDPSDVPPLPPSAQVKTYSEAMEDLNREESDQEVVSQEPVRMYNGKPANSPQSFGGVVNGTPLDGFYFYTIKHPTGITLNGKHFDAGSYWFDQATYEGILNIDLPFQ